MGNGNVLFAQIQKVDEEKRLVYGRATEESVDHSDEIFDYATSKPYFENWSASVNKDSGGKSLGNLRAMHGKVAAGKLTEIMFKDDEKAIDVVAKVVDDAEWKKVVEGVYTGFSIGGTYVKTWDDETNSAHKRYTADPVELSLVDRPCVGKATFFEVHKAGGALMKVDFRPAATTEPTEAEKLAAVEAETAAAKAATATVTETADELVVDGSADDVTAFAKALNDNKLSMKDVLALVAESVAAKVDAGKTAEKPGESKYGNVKFADAVNKKYPIDTVEHIKAAWSYINKAKNADKYSASELDTVKANIVAAWKEKIDKDGPPSAEAEKADFVLTLAKGMYTCGSLGFMLQDLAYMVSSVEWEEAAEGDGSGISARLRECMVEMGSILKDMVNEEVGELTGGDDTDGELSLAEFSASVNGLAKLEKRAPAVVEKAGARNSAKDQTAIQSMHDNAVALGADCGDAEKHEHGGTLSKFLEVNDQLAKALESNATLAKDMTAMAERLVKLEKQPMPTRVSLRAVAKGEDVGDHVGKTLEVTPVTTGGEEVNEAATMIKMAHKQGGANVFGR